MQQQQSFINEGDIKEGWKGEAEDEYAVKGNVEEVKEGFVEVDGGD